MTAGWEKALERADDDLEAASQLFRSGHFAQACSRAYFAAFTSASGALLRLGETRSKHAGILQLRWLFDLRNRADYQWDPLTKEEAGEALAGARRCVGAVRVWMDRGIA